MSEGPLDLLVLGDCNPDLVLADPELVPQFGQAERLVERAELTIGGSGAIMACGAARLGLRTALAAVSGDDLFGRFMAEALTERGVQTGGIVVDSELQTGITVILARPDDRAILTFPGAIAELRCSMVDGALLARARHVHVSAFFLQRALVDGLSELLASVRARGGTTSLDPNWDPFEEWDGGLLELLPFVDVLLPNAAEVCAIAGVGEPVDAALRLAQAGPLVVVKMGSQGAVAAQAGGGVVRVPAVEVQGVVDAVGAGDSFDAGFLTGWLDGWDLPRALALACACGALSMRGAGGTAAQATRAEADAITRPPR
ncbi:MAG: carbohydrate kinase family protein [Solirubrobacteraceae bacterium]